ncbi:MAG: WhiB family transcriptional regulator [Bifidobacterium psychraerophilum]|uniref:WhiB family transcriptional regulator n=1 Tax=Bifidobacterium psychraerophilum TaxID=218140 RepID=UPI0039EACE59
MWRVVDDSADESADRVANPLWGLFKPDADLSWQHEALCAQTDPEAFFPDKGGSTREAKKVCARCEVREQCLQWAVDHDERFGIWGGMSERERRRYKKERSRGQV